MQTKTYPLYLSRSQLKRVYELANWEAQYAGCDGDEPEFRFWDLIAKLILDLLAAGE